MNKSRQSLKRLQFDFCLIGNFDYLGSSFLAFACAQMQYFKMNNHGRAKMSAQGYLEQTTFPL